LRVNVRLKLRILNIRVGMVIVARLRVQKKMRVTKRMTDAMK